VDAGSQQARHRWKAPHPLIAAIVRPRPGRGYSARKPASRQPDRRSLGKWSEPGRPASAALRTFCCMQSSDTRRSASIHARPCPAGPLGPVGSCPKDGETLAARSHREQGKSAGGLARGHQADRGRDHWRPPRESRLPVPTRASRGKPRRSQGTRQADHHQSVEAFPTGRRSRHSGTRRSASSDPLTPQSDRPGRRRCSDAESRVEASRPR
jgi:hypothetical protein